MTETKPPKDIRTRLREWFRTAGLTSGAYFFQGRRVPAAAPLARSALAERFLWETRWHYCNVFGALYEQA